MDVKVEDGHDCLSAKSPSISCYNSEILLFFSSLQPQCHAYGSCFCFSLDPLWQSIAITLVAGWLLMQAMFPASPCFQVQHPCAVLQDEPIFPMNAHPTGFVATATTSTVMTVQTRPGKVRVVFNCVPRGLEKRGKMLATRKVSERLRLKPPISITCGNCCNLVYGALG